MMLALELYSLFVALLSHFVVITCAISRSELNDTVVEA
jgi:hypothetical protein